MCLQMSVRLMACVPLQRRVNGAVVMFVLAAKCHFGRLQSLLELKIGVESQVLSRTYTCSSETQPRISFKGSAAFFGINRFRWFSVALSQ